MSTLAFAALAVATALAVNDWLAVYKKQKVLEYVCKPGTMLALIVFTLSIDVRSGSQRWAVVVALVFSLLGDVFLMLPDDRFIAGVGSFFCAHIAYIVAFRLFPTSTTALLVGAAFVVAVALFVGRPVLVGVHSKQPEMVTPVSAYLAIISVMVASAIATKNPYAVIGAIVFMASDSLIAWNRFVQPLSWAPVTIMVTYHVGQLLLVLSLLAR